MTQTPRNPDRLNIMITESERPSGSPSFHDCPSHKQPLLYVCLNKDCKVAKLLCSKCHLDNHRKCTEMIVDLEQLKAQLFEGKKYRKSHNTCDKEIKRKLCDQLRSINVLKLEIDKLIDTLSEKIRLSLQNHDDACQIIQRADEELQEMYIPKTAEEFQDYITRLSQDIMIDPNQQGTFIYHKHQRDLTIDTVKEMQTIDTDIIVKSLQGTKETLSSCVKGFQYSALDLMEEYGTVKQLKELRYYNHNLGGLRVKFVQEDFDQGQQIFQFFERELQKFSYLLYVVVDLRETRFDINHFDMILRALKSNPSIKEISFNLSKSTFNSQMMRQLALSTKGWEVVAAILDNIKITHQDVRAFITEVFRREQGTQIRLRSEQQRNLQIKSFTSEIIKQIQAEFKEREAFLDIKR